MESFAKKLAINNKIQKKSSEKTFPIINLNKNFDIIEKAYNVLNESIFLNVPIPPSGEWLLDNYYLIEEQFNSVKNDLLLEKYKELPSINGTSRILFLARKLIEYTDANITEENVGIFLRAYQSKKSILMKELWLMPVMLKIAIIEYISVICEKILDSQLQKFKVESLVERIIKNKSIQEQNFLKYKNIKIDTEATAYVEHLIYSLKRYGKEGKKYTEILEEEIKKVGTSTNDVVKFEHYDMAIRRVSMGNSITSIRNISRYNWQIIFEDINGIEKILLKDNCYENCDYETRDSYRAEIQNISKKTKISEKYIASKLVEIAGEEHIGEYLIGEKKDELYRALGYKYRESKNVLVKYLLAIYLPTIIVSILVTKEYFLLALIPLSEVFLNLVNKIVSKNKIPKRLPRIEKIQENVSTFVVVPTLLNSTDRVKKMIQNLEIYYLGNKMENLYFALLGDASETSKEKMEYDDDIIKVGREEVEKLNKKYGKEIFFFLYRKRVYNEKQGTWLGYERKRGMLTEFNNFLLTGEQGTFITNTINKNMDIKYVITLDADTELVMDSAKKLIGIMEHPLNKPEIQNGIVVKGYGIVQPKVGISLESSKSSIFAEIFAGSGGIDIYSTAESNVYQDLFGEAIFTGKGIYNVKVFNDVLSKEIPENTVLSHDLLEGSYIRCGLASDIEVIDGFPAKVNSYMLRQHRWTRGDFQILRWIWQGPLNLLSRYKIFDNLRRSTVSIFTLLLMFFGFYNLALFTIFFSLIIDVFEKIISLFNNKKICKNKKYKPIISGIVGSLYRCTLNFILLPYNAVLMLEAIIVTLYRVFISKKHLLEWVTAADAEKLLGNNLSTFIKEMWINPLIGTALMLASFNYFPHFFNVTIAIFFLWSLAPLISYIISKPIKQEIQTENINDKELLLDIAKRTWNYFETYMNKENNFLPPDNYQEKRKNEVTKLTSSTNIGLGLLAIMAASDLGFIDSKKKKEMIKNNLDTIEKLEKWNGHLYNWYNIRNLEVVIPKFVSTVDSGNFVGYLYVLKGMMIEEKWEADLIKRVDKLIEETDFNKLYDEKKNLFSVGFDDREGILVDSYYDLLASEARQASFVAIAKRDVPYKHWFNLGRTLTTLNGHKGLISWAGTMFEYFMPSIIMKNFSYTLMDETYEFCIYSQKKYAQKLNIPWGISESAFNIQDLNYNYQYKAFGIPWLGVKRGLKNEIVVSPYSSIMTITKNYNAVIKNLKELIKIGAYDKFGFYDSIDYTRNRIGKNEYAVVKTYMAHHQGLILSSINNFLNKNIFIERFNINPEILSVQILLQERVPENVIFTKEKKEKIKVQKYKYYEEYSEEEVKEETAVNILSNDKYMLVLNNKGEGYSKYKEIILNRYKNEQKQGDIIYITNKENGKTWTTTLKPEIKEPDEYRVIFSPAKCEFFRSDEGIETKTKIIVSPEDNVEIRQLEIKNTTDKDIDVVVSKFTDPVLCAKDADIVSPAFNKLFLNPIKHEKGVIVEKRNRSKNEEKIFYLNSVFIIIDEELQMNIEVDKNKIIGRKNNIKNPDIIKENFRCSNNVEITSNLAIAFQQKFKIKAKESIKINFVTAISNDLDTCKALYEKYKSNEIVERMFELAISKSVIENRFWGYTMKNIVLYNKVFKNIIEGSKTKENYKKYIEENKLTQRNLWKFGISGDLPIITVKIKNPDETEIINQLVSAIEYFNRKNIKVDLVIIDEEKNRYEQYTYERIYEIINSKALNYLLNINGGIHILKINDISNDEINLLYACSDIILNTHYDLLEETL